MVQVVSGVETEMEWTIGELRRSHTQTVNQNGINTGLGICPRSINSSDQQYARVHPVLRPSQGVSHPTSECLNLLSYGSTDRRTIILLLCT